MEQNNTHNKIYLKRRKQDHRSIVCLIKFLSRPAMYFEQMPHKKSEMNAKMEYKVDEILFLYQKGKTNDNDMVTT